MRVSPAWFRYNSLMPCVIWITGLPGSGKSVVSLSARDKVPGSVILRMDDFRRIVTPEPDYSDGERELVYRALVFTAKTLYELGHSVIIDATGNRKRWRDLARELIPNFFEVYLKCPVAVCMERERTRMHTHAAPRGIYEKAEKGWPVPGVTVPYEEPDKPEIVIDAEKEPPDAAAGKIASVVAGSPDER